MMRHNIGHSNPQPVTADFMLIEDFNPYVMFTH
jgi:hypothetical protein